MRDINLKEKFQILMEWKKLDQGLRLISELNELLLSNEFLKDIT